MVTRGAQEELKIELGSPVVAVIKAGGVHLVSRMV
jgi:molybdopterin-binding protein